MLDNQAALIEARKFLSSLNIDFSNPNTFRKITYPDLWSYSGDLEEDELINIISEIGLETPTIDDLLAATDHLTQQSTKRQEIINNEIFETKLKISELENETGLIKNQIRITKSKNRSMFGIWHYVIIGVVIVLLLGLVTNLTGNRTPSREELACEALGGRSNWNDTKCIF